MSVHIGADGKDIENGGSCTRGVDSIRGNASPVPPPVVGGRVISGEAPWSSVGA